MDKLKELLLMDPCYEQHIVSIKDIYEEYLFSLLIPALYEGFQSLYKRSYELEQKYIATSKRNPDIENPGILAIFQTLIREIPNLNNHKIRIETDRIKSSSKSAEVFDDLVRAICKANIILLTYNVDHKRKTLLQTNYHENIIIYDFVHSCYIHSARVFFGCSELFFHKYETIVLNQNKRTCFKIIKDAIKEAIRLMLPMKEILLEYNKQKYEQKEKNYFMPNASNVHQQILNYPGNVYPHQSAGVKIKLPPGVSHEEYIDMNKFVDNEINQYRNSEHSLLEESNNDNASDELVENGFGSNYDELRKENNKDFSLLLNSDSQTDENEKEKGKEKDKSEIHETKEAPNNDIPSIKPDVSKDKGNEDETNKIGSLSKEKTSDSDKTIKMIDISGAISKKGNASTFFNETMPDIKKRFTEYKEKKKNNKEPKIDKKEKNNKLNNDDIKITRSQSIESTQDDKASKDEKNAKVENLVNDMLKI